MPPTIVSLMRDEMYDLVFTQAAEGLERFFDGRPLQKQVSRDMLNHIA